MGEKVKNNSKAEDCKRTKTDKGVVVVVVSCFVPEFSFTVYWFESLEAQLSVLVQTDQVLYRFFVYQIRAVFY